ncbi:MAG: glutathione S-transferase family protein [Phenylobacterium sp.]|uniref:glutathione S-transferase family protein n=1 Tax=Phenylobacterium sp. TaxID=1871053 RepID=UPI001B4623DA|nr:glutathione S-transferase family protein [Phenylobacterium sp.]MBP7650629.1 glutathione S-transferase family protein [Phenylobacterium sp.]MBP7818181.1 glutathione S-transferase family protein [Phenylobacterium sp.]MBP9231620.1 glutathione S-transferase family protein [Phenylobacterium sp.]MBP9756098.1 glutathione S-transferase family protein [Phenylobacterium sp.]
MSLTLYSHPFSSYCQKVLTALWENAIPFTYRHLEEPGAGDELAALWPVGRFPVLVDNGLTVAESSIIIEHLALHHPGPVRLLPDDRAAALEVRFMDRFFDQYIMSAMQKPVFEALRTDGGRKVEVMAEAVQALDTAYGWLEQRLKGRTWAAGDSFTMADCAAAPSLFYADWVHQISPEFPRLRDYRAQLLARPSFARAVEEARPYRSYFPLGAPDRD